MQIKRGLPLILHVAVGLGMCIGATVLCAQTNDAKLENYSQWKLALGDGQLADPVQIVAPKGFAVEIVRQATQEEGSWISMTWDPRGRLLVGREDKGVLRFSFSANHRDIQRVETVNDTLREPRGLLVAHGSLYVMANSDKGLYRLRDTDDNDTYDQVQLLRKLEGGTGHGRNGLALGPDGLIYVALGNNVKVPDDVDPRSSYQRYGLDRLTPCVWNEFLFDSDVTPPAGHIARTDAEGKRWELVAGGFRNPYDLAFNDDGDLFTYDADMEWDVGAPWYRPTAVMHVVPGGEYGWRQGTNVWPDFYADSLPRVVDIGLGSPTGVAFGTNSKFPASFRKALFVLDWAYGRILAVHLTPRGASYTGKAETFVQGKPLNVTDIAFGPDGAMYFTVGGRRTRSALYRVRYTGENLDDAQATETEQESKGAWERAQRQRLERFAKSMDEAKLAEIWTGLGSEDPFVVFAARAALENHSLDDWEPTAFDVEGTDVDKVLPALLSLTRCSANDVQPALLERLEKLLTTKLTLPQRLTALRACELALIRLDAPSDKERRALAETIEAGYPAADWSENYLRCELLVALGSPVVVERTLPLLEKAENDAQRLFYLFMLRQPTKGWTIESRRALLHWLKRAEQFGGAHYMPRFITYIRSDILAGLSDRERRLLAPEIAVLGRLAIDAQAGTSPSSGSTLLTTHRPQVKVWALEDALAAVSGSNRQPEIVRGKKLFAEIHCNRCHRSVDQGVPLGPDLTHVTARFSRRDLLDAIINPSRIIEDKYRSLLLETDDGRLLSGVLVGGDAKSFYIAADPLQPVQFQQVSRDRISSRRTSSVSTMPQHLLNTLTAEEIVDLLGYLEGVARLPRN